MAREGISRPCLGRRVALGQLYDAKTDTICGTTISFQQEVIRQLFHFPRDLFPEIHRMCHFCRDHFPEIRPLFHFPWDHFPEMHQMCHFCRNLFPQIPRMFDSSREHFTEIRGEMFPEYYRALGVTGDIKLSLLANMVVPEGSDGFLSNQGLSARKNRISLVYTRYTGTEVVDFSDQAVLQGISARARDLAPTSATHVVHEIDYGLRMVFTQSNQGEPYFCSDIPLGYLQPPTTIGGFMDLVLQMRNRLDNTPHERSGRPLSMRLIPVEQLQQYLDQPLFQAPRFQEMGWQIADGIVHAFEDFQEEKQELYDFKEDLRGFQYCVRDEEVERICGYYTQVEDTYDVFRSRLASLLRQVRGGVRDPIVLMDMTHEITRSTMEISDTMTRWGGVREKVKTAQLFKSNGIKYIGLRASLDMELLDPLAAEESYLLFFSQAQKTENQDGWTQNLNLFLESFNELGGDGTNFFAVDCDLHPGLLKESIRIQVVRGSVKRVIKQDLLVERENRLV